jgi:acyl phosphate:glycerol-3-phosphate acyltransferase
MILEVCGMNVTILIVLLLALSYSIGSLNGAKLFTNDISKRGTKNAGAANAGRMYGRKTGALVLVWDMGRGAFIVFLAMQIFNRSKSFTLLCAILGMVGHNWPPQFRFQGGKGIAIMGGALLALHPLSLLSVLALSGFLLLPEKQKSGLIPFAAVPIYICLQFVPILSYMNWPFWGTEDADWKLITAGFGILAVIFIRRLHAEWDGFRKAPSKKAALWYLLVYDRSDNNPPPRLRIINWFLNIPSSSNKQAPLR